ncbi:MAG: acyl carrier protein [Ruminococcus sp.]|jgi:acyl carrier protein|nr:acyl carrier protein [Ruminococcus sp.]
MIMEQLQEIFRDVFADDAIVLQGTTTSSDIEDWDSLAHIQLISEIENHFGIQFTLQEAVAASNVSEFVQIIESKL